MKTPPQIILIRPDGKSADDFKRRLQALDVQVLHCPVTRIEALPHSAEQMIPGALVFTSANAALHYQAPAGALNAPAYAVGPETAEALRGMGFTDIRNVAATAAALADSIAVSGLPHAASILYVRGREISFELAPALQKKGFMVQEKIVYAAEELLDLPAQVIAAIQARHIQAALFFSKRTATHFMNLAKQNNLLQDLSTIAPLSISAAVLECVQPAYWSRAYIARTPDRKSMHEACALFVNEMKETPK